MTIERGRYGYCRLQLGERYVAIAAKDLASIGSAISVANMAVAASTTGVLAAWCRWPRRRCFRVTYKQLSGAECSSGDVAVAAGGNAVVGLVDFIGSAFQLGGKADPRRTPALNG